MISQQNISANTLMGANIVPGGGATFRVWAPRATAVYLNGVFGGVARSGQTDDLLLSKDASALSRLNFWVDHDGFCKAFRRMAVWFTSKFSLDNALAAIGAAFSIAPVTATYITSG